jgi:hypothetical protein
MELKAILLLLAVIHLATPQSRFCSVLCGTSCSGNLNTQCGTSCQSDGAWSLVNGACVPRPTWVYFDSTPDYNSGTLSISTATTSTCSSVNYYGFVDSQTSIVVSSPGITIPHYMMKIYVGIIALDVDCRSGGGGGGISCGGGGCPNPSNYWNTGSSRFNITFDDLQGTETPATNPFSYRVRSNTRTRTDCGACRFREYYTRAARQYSTHNSTVSL